MNLGREGNSPNQVHSGEDDGSIQVIIRQIVSYDEEEPLLLEHETLGK